MRYVVGRSKIHKIKKSVSKFINYEKRKNIDSIKGCLTFKKNVSFQKKTEKKITRILKKGKK